MSQVENKLRWFLNKAKKELHELGKHRGLVIRMPDLTAASAHINKAEHNLNALLYLENGGFSDWSVSAGFYCVYHCFLAILAKEGYESRNQECTLAAIEHLIEINKIKIDQKFVYALMQYDERKHTESTIIELRESLQYGAGTQANVNDLSKLKKLCKEALNSTKE